MAKFHTQGTKVEVHNAAGAFIEVSHCSDVNGPGGQAAVIDKTDLQSTAKEKDMGLPDWGQVTFSCFYDPDDAGQTRLISLRGSQTSDSFKITLPDDSATEITFDGYVLGNPLSNNIDDMGRISFTIEVDGDVEGMD